MKTSNGREPRKVLLAEFNEITWRLVDPFCDRGKLPTFSEYVREGTRGAPVATEVPPNLDPWISWTSLYTGHPQEEHGVHFLEQPPETVTGPHIWDIAADAGKSLGVFGSIMSWPPRHDIRGFWVPGTFSPGSETHPETLVPIQELNLAYTRAHSPLAAKVKASHTFTRLAKLMKLGLKPATLAEIASFFVRSRINPDRSWEKVCLQPLVNLDFFESLYRRYRPDFATFHTNHIAHYMHRHWRAMDPTAFKVKPAVEEVRRYGPSIEYGYRVGDRLLKRLWGLVDDNTVVVLASGPGHQPYVDEDFQAGRPVVRLRDINQIVDLCGLTGHCDVYSVMAPQWNVRIPDPARRSHAEAVLDTAWVGSPESKLFSRITKGDTICFNIFQKGLKTLDFEAQCIFPEASGRRMKFGDLCAAQDPTPKEGCHETVGLAVLRGAGIRRGAKLGACTNLDIAPTILHLMGLPIPSHMKGRVLEEALEGPKSVRVPAEVTPEAKTASV